MSWPRRPSNCSNPPGAPRCPPIWPVVPPVGTTADALAEVTAILQSEPVPAMPPAVAERLDRVVAAEQDRRAGRRALSLVTPSESSLPTRPTLGGFGEDLPRRRRGRVLVSALAAAAAAAVVGFGGYVLSARAGLDEPPPVAAVSLSDLGAQAGALERAANLGPHRFSRAWQCARQVTSGRITGLASTTVDGAPALLVYTNDDDVDRVTVVTGCNTGRRVARSVGGPALSPGQAPSGVE